MVKKCKINNVQEEIFLVNCDNCDNNSRGICKKREFFLLKANELAIGENIMCYSRRRKMACLMAQTKREAVISSRVLKGSRRTRERQYVF